MSLTVSQLFLHPMKSAAALEVMTLDFDQHGPRYDRQWMGVDKNGKFITQRHYPKMCLIQPVLDGDVLSLSAPGMQRITVGEPDALRSVMIWQDEVVAGDCGDQSASWLSEYLGLDCRLVSVIPQTGRRVDPDYAQSGETVGFADGFPVLLASQASLDGFNSHLENAVAMQRFRPNIVISGCDAYAEDQWQQVEIGDIALSLVKPCSRCIMPSIDPTTGVKQMAVNDALLATRRRGRETYFGQNAIYRGTGIIRVGQSVNVRALLAEKSP